MNTEVIAGIYALTFLAICYILKRIFDQLGEIRKELIAITGAQKPLSGLECNLSEFIETYQKHHVKNSACRDMAQLELQKLNLNVDHVRKLVIDSKGDQQTFYDNQEKVDVQLRENIEAVLQEVQGSTKCAEQANTNAEKINQFIKESLDSMKNAKRPRPKSEEMESLMSINGILAREYWNTLSSEARIRLLWDKPSFGRYLTNIEFEQSPAIIRITLAANAGFRDTNKDLKFERTLASPDNPNGSQIDWPKLARALVNRDFVSVAKALRPDELLIYMMTVSHTDISSETAIAFFDDKTNDRNWPKRLTSNIFDIASRRSLFCSYDCEQEKAGNYFLSYYAEKEYKNWWRLALKTKDATLKESICWNFPLRNDSIFRVPEAALEDTRIREVLILRGYEPALRASGGTE
jgi:hypothetical protein